MCSSGFTSPVKCKQKNEKTKHACPPGLFCDMSVMLCCPLLLALPSINTKIRQTNVISALKNSSVKRNNRVGNNGSPSIRRQNGQIITSLLSNNNKHSQNNNVALAPMRSLINGNGGGYVIRSGGTGTFDNAPTQFFSRRPQHPQPQTYQTSQILINGNNGEVINDGDFPNYNVQTSSPKRKRSILNFCCFFVCFYTVILFILYFFILFLL